jgi:CheY-like chemotaxis protein
LLDDAPAIRADLGQLFEALACERGPGPERQDRLQDLFCKVHFLASAAGQSEFALLAQAIGVLDALLYVLMESPEKLDPSLLRTVGSLVELVGLLFQDARESGVQPVLSGRVLVVTGDPETNEMAVAALRQAQFDACSSEDSLVAWQWINGEHFDLVLLDLEMPVLSGSEPGQRLRMVPGYEKTSIIFATDDDDLDSRSTGALSGADDFIAKPFLPQELAARVVLHLLRPSYL